ncbi:MAG: amino acid adenylation domain-containing protein [Actinomycetota bacterium]|nr:amino acid adenylation domain-containing protein [Actinomycetota bacterium]
MAPGFLLQHLVEEAAAANPDREAVRCRGRSLTYGQLEAASASLARTLAEAGVRQGDRVAIHLPKGVETVAAVYGVLRAGAAYVPLDPKAPIPRVAGIAADCAVAAVVSTASRAPALLEALPHRPSLAVVVGEDDGAVKPDLPITSVAYEEAAGASGPAPQVSLIDDDLAYILYTSGSTGVPKGVMLSHRAALTFVEWAVRRIRVRPDDRLSNHAPLHFDLSVFDLFAAALAGAPVVLVPDDAAYFGASLVELVREEGITVWYSVPSALVLLTRALREPLTALRVVVFAGEVYPTPRLRELAGVLPEAELWNLYGPTETNVCTYYPVLSVPEDDRPIPIGRACENTDVFALKEDGSVAGVGEVGELYVRGGSLMKGYWGRPELTAKVLVPNPLAPHIPDPVYRTGDLVRLRDDGDYDFLGRRDHQIKSRGYRIELGDIEAAMTAHPAVAEGIAVALPHEEWGTEIAVCVVLKPGAAVTDKEIKRHIAGLLPRYMVPTRVEFLDDLPRTSTGKADRQQLRSDLEAAANA